MTVAAVSSHKLTADSNSAFSSGYHRTRIASSETRRPSMPVHRPSQDLYRLQRCSSERWSDNDGVDGGFGTWEYRSCAACDGSATTLQQAASYHPPPYRPRCHSSHLTTANPLQRKDIFYSGSVLSLHGSATLGRLRSHPNVDPTVVDVESPELQVQSAAQTPTRSPCCVAGGGKFSTLCETIDVLLFRNCSFLVICASNVFIQLAYFVPVVFLTPYTQTLNLTTADGAFFLSVIGRYCVFLLAAFYCIT